MAKLPVWYRFIVPSFFLTKLIQELNRKTPNDIISLLIMLRRLCKSYKRTVTKLNKHIFSEIQCSWRVLHTTNETISVFRRRGIYSRRKTNFQFFFYTSAFKVRKLAIWRLINHFGIKSVLRNAKIQKFNAADGWNIEILFDHGCDATIMYLLSISLTVMFDCSALSMRSINSIYLLVVSGIEAKRTQQWYCWQINFPNTVHIN